jgi:RimJ/RimL family protein N-acetyltransferase
MDDAAWSDDELPRPPEPSGERVKLRLPEDADAPALFEVFGDAEVMRYWSAPPMPDVEEARAYAERSRHYFAQRLALQWAIVRREDERAIGSVALFEIRRAQGRCSLGYTLGRAHWRRGLAREAVALALDVAFGALALRRVEADADPRNLPSAKLLAALGFVHEGTLRERWLVDGETQDSAIYGILAREWRTRP